jgi:hypothetical protein
MELPESKIKKLPLCYLALDHIAGNLPRMTLVYLRCRTGFECSVSVVKKLQDAL